MNESLSDTEVIQQQGAKWLQPWYGLWARAISLLFAFSLSMVILVLPHVVAKTTEELDHGTLTLAMLAMSGSFVHGMGFIPKGLIWRLLFSPIASWPICVWASWQWLV